MLAKTTGRQQNGFTLVEIAIVLVIVGLLIGGVLKGREMITNARLKKVETQNSEISIAILSYYDRYLAFPGDDPGATSKFSTYVDGIDDPPANDINGNGDGSVDGNWIGVPNSETANLWKHLRAAGFIPGNGDDDTQPKNVYNGDIGVREGSLQISGRVTVFGLIDGSVARVLEAKLDDGNPSEGKVQSDLNTNLMDGSIASSAGPNYTGSTVYFMAIKI